jgi:hypothetical protein
MKFLKDLKYRAMSGVIGALLSTLHRTIPKVTRLEWKRFALTYTGRQDDIFLVSYPRSGTTLTQMLLYQLLTDGEIRFNHISEFSPFLERDINISQRVDPIAALRKPCVIKSHLPYDCIPKGPGRYIYLMRNGMDTTVSFYYLVAKRAGHRLQLPPFFDSIIKGGGPAGSWFEHVAKWRKNEDNLNVLYVTYEELRFDFLSTARRVADFCNVKIPDREWERVCSNCSFEFMRQHEHKFDDLVPWVGDEQDRHFIRRGQVGEWRTTLSPEMVQQFRDKYDATLGHLGLPAYLSDDDTARELMTVPRV